MIKRIHHIGIVVRSLEEGCRFYRDALGLPLRKEAVVQEQGVKAALLTLGDCEIELLEPIDPQGGVARFLERRGEGLHHICFQIDDIDAELAGLKERGVELIDQQPRNGLAGLICFLHPRAHRGVLVELAQPVDEEGA
jgi:methylmalonyl-CoA/ethylmalonyl-CoA epimerase